MHYFEVLKEPRYEDFDIQYMGDGNRFAFLGNGYTETELDEHGKTVAIEHLVLQNEGWSRDESVVEPSET